MQSTTNKISVGIIGGAGYTAGELIRILINHPMVKISFINSSSNAGKQVSEVHDDLFGECNLTFSSKPILDVNVVFLCQGHGKAKKVLEENEFSDSTKIIDLGNDFRLHADADFDGKSFVYGLPELQRDKIKKSNYIANPGCFATCIQLALLPLAKAGIIKNEIHVNAITGSTGAGQNPSATSHFSWRNNNVSVYKAFTHQHLGEITESLVSLQSSMNYDINFIPVRGNFTKGIFGSIYTECDLSVEEATELYNNFYAEHPFVSISEKGIHLKQVVNSNKCILHLEKHRNKLLITSIIDNLVKGASGQAVQNMNLIFGLEETMGLKLKTVAF
ncbi:N-acetyl-gamma-glutamyl-phosphate reductase [Reichenbachiella sp. MALMAid0571]|uniref:N-acetyl-gamma-glutamyl-phosphate reductase n=1 Tax=Reichenbachiella sp. MALMAid0571 TaxID=3143939 RepID=UPI0032DF4362